MTAAVGHPTLRLVRVAIGPLTLRGLAPGEWRELTEREAGRCACAAAVEVDRAFGNRTDELFRGEPGEVGTARPR